MGGEEAAAEVDRLCALLRERYGERLTAAQIEDVRKGVEGVVQSARALRGVRLANADAPFSPFVPFRADS